MMRILPICAGLLVMSASFSFGQRFNPQPPDEPPHQRTPWRPAASVPANLLSAVKTLFGQGFPDPRGCEYREIEIEVSSVWGRPPALAQTRGWVLPKQSGETRRYAIAWNGVIYPVSKVGAAADLHAEALALVPPPSRRFNAGIGEIRSVYSTNAGSTRVPLLIRCGETEAGLRSWVPEEQTMTQLQSQMGKPPSEIGKAENYDPYLELAGDWAWALFDHVLCAHIRGEESLALRSARRLAQLEPRIEREAAKRRFPRPYYEDSARRGKKGPYLGFLDQLPRLLSDLERRAREGRRVSVIQSGLENFPLQADRIRALIRDLDFVKARQWSQPGSVDLTEDPLVTALIKEGDAAVEPLLNCLETDKRLTRSVAFHRDFFRKRTVLQVASAARAALQGILHTEFSGGAPEIRAYWKQFKGTHLEDRWYLVLKDDTAGLARWQEAAANITQPENVTTVPGSGFSRTERPVGAGPVRMRGESLRGKSAPSVASLMSRRALEVPSSHPGDYDLAAACEIALSLAGWEQEAAGPVAKVLVERCRTAQEYATQPRSWPVQRLGTFIAKLTVARIRAGNPQALEDYAAWVKTITPEGLDSYALESLEPLGKFATNAAVQAAAESLFGSTNSPWSKLPWKGAAGFRDPLESDLINLPAFRRLLARELEKTNVIGSIQWEAPVTARYQINNYGSGSRALTFAGAGQPPYGTQGQLRWCDWIAWSLSNRKRIPFFNPFGSIDQRDQAITEAKTSLGAR